MPHLGRSPSENSPMLWALIAADFVVCLPRGHSGAVAAARRWAQAAACRTRSRGRQPSRSRTPVCSTSPQRHCAAVTSPRRPKKQSMTLCGVFERVGPGLVSGRVCSRRRFIPPDYRAPQAPHRLSCSAGSLAAPPRARSRQPARLQRPAAPGPRQTARPHGFPGASDGTLADLTQPPALAGATLVNSAGRTAGAAQGRYRLRRTPSRAAAAPWTGGGAPPRRPTAPPAVPGAASAVLHRDRRG